MRQGRKYSNYEDTKNIQHNNDYARFNTNNKIRNEKRRYSDGNNGIGIVITTFNICNNMLGSFIKKKEGKGNG